jgi:hypothetical protein
MLIGKIPLKEASYTIETLSEIEEATLLAPKE